jgi:uncharacterized protein DUF3105
MAQRKSGGQIPTKSGPNKSGAAKPGAAKPGAAKPGAAPKAGPLGAPPSGRPPAKRKPGKSIVNQRQTPWGLIATATVIVLFAAAIVVAVVVTHKSKPAANAGCSAMVGSNATTYLNELKCAADIQGVTFKQEPNRNHVSGVIKYDATPPVGGNHSPYWADCAGTVYPNAIANENAVHMLEHGAVWITYNPTLPANEIATLANYVNGQDRMAMSPYPDLPSGSLITVQAWGYQLSGVQSASDPRIQKFIDALRFNPKTTPEYGSGVSCSQPTFKAHPSTFGHPLDQPAT